MNPALLQASSAFAALALIGWAVASFLNGSAASTGTIVREAVAEGLGTIRQSTDMGRGELAEATLLCAAGLAMVGMLVERSPIMGIMAVLLWVGRESVARSMAEERPLLALAGNFTADLVIGVVVPLLLAQVLLGRYVLAMTLLMVVVSLSWPAGGTTFGRSAHRPAWHA